MSRRRSTWDPRPAQWPFLAALVLALGIVLSALLLRAPGLFLVAYIPVLWFFAHLWHCFRWGARHGDDIEEAFR